MKLMRLSVKLIMTVCLLSLCAFGASAVALGQKPIKPPTAAAPAPPPPPAAPAKAATQEDESRQIFYEYTESRPKKAAAGVKAARKSAPRYVRKTAKAVAKGVKGATAAGAKAAAAQAMELSQVGVTLWKLRPSDSMDDKETRIIVQEEEEQRTGDELTPVRIESDTPFHNRDKMRLSIESPRAGYLYVIDREQYADGTMSAPYLIFPTLRTRGGNNKVQAGMLVDIPAQEDRPNYFTMKPSRATQVAEVLTIVVTPEPLDVPPLQRKALLLPEQQVTQWERDWKAEAERFEMEGGAGQAWTKEEKAAGASADAALLNQDDPAPQTIYRVAVKPGKPVMLSLPLRYETKSTAPVKSESKMRLISIAGLN